MKWAKTMVCVFIKRDMGKEKHDPASQGETSAVSFQRSEHIKRLILVVIASRKKN